MRTVEATLVVNSERARPDLVWAVPGLVALVLWSSFPDDMERIRALTVAGMSIYLSDFFYAILLMSSILVIVKRKMPPLDFPSKLYLVFLAWLLVCVVRGYLTYSYRAIGEARYVIPFLGFCLPFALLGGLRGRKEQAAAKLIETVIYLAGITSLLMLFVELVHGGRIFMSEANQVEFGSFEDFRGKRYLGSIQTLNIMALALMFAFRIQESRNSHGQRFVYLILLLCAALVTRNRAAILSVTLSYMLVLLFLRRYRQFVILLLFAGSGLYLSTVAISEDPLNISASLSSGLAPWEDETGAWRLVQNAAAIEQGLANPIAGVGFGGYYYLEVPGMDPIEAPVHNQYILLFLKGGIVAVIICLGWISFYSMKFSHILKHEEIDHKSRVYASWLLVFCVSQFAYGMAYTFSPFFGFYLGCGAIILSEQSKIPELNSESKRTG